MENPTYSCLKPRRLVMITSNCFYCNSPDSRSYIIGHLFGLRYCSLHKLSAIRDCKAYMHENKCVSIRDAYDHPVIGRFLNVLDITFPILRSNYEIQLGGRLNRYTSECILHDGGEWKIPVQWMDSSGNNLFKHMAISSFKLPAIYERIQTAVPTDFLSLIDEVLFCLIDGIYSKEYEEAQKYGEKEEVPEIPGTVGIEWNGVPGRIFIPPSLSLIKENSMKEDDPTTT